MKNLLLLIFSVSSFCTSAQNPFIIKAVKGTITEPSSHDQVVWANNEWNGKFFYAGTGSPTKLCVTDGTNAGTVYLADIGSGGISHTFPAQDFIYIITNRFVSFSPFTTETQIYKSDGTAAGTVLVKTMPQVIGASNGPVFYSDRDNQRNFSIIGNTMFFGAHDPANGRELWVTDGTNAGTHIVKDIKPGTGNSDPGSFCKLGNEVFFTAYQTTLERKLWKTDGTTAGTVQIAVPEPFFVADLSIAVVNNKMILYAHNTVNGFEPYVSDGTAAGTFMLADINPAGNSFPTVSQNVHFRFNNKHCFFIANNGANFSLWRTDGTVAGTFQLTANAQNVQSGVSGGAYTDVDSTGLYMIEYNSSGSGNAEKLYKSDGSVAGTYQCFSNLSYAANLKIYNRAAWMGSRDIGQLFNIEPWRSDGTPANTNRAFEIGAASISSDPFGFFVKNNNLFFFAAPTGSTLNLYRYTGDFTFNGTLAGGKWKDSANWNSMMPPGVTDTVKINFGTPNALNVTAQNAYAGTLILQNDAVINLTNITDSLIVNTSLITGLNNSFTGNGILALKNKSNADVQISNGFSATNLALQNTGNLISGNLTISNNINLLNNSKLILNNNQLNLTGNTSNATVTSGSYIVTNGTGKMVIENIGTGARTAAQTFPVGTLSNYNPITFSNTGVADNFAARVIQGLTSNYSAETPQSPFYSAGAVNATWFITEAVAGGSNAAINLQWNQSQEMPAFDRSFAQFGHYTGGTWVLSPAAAASGTNPYNFTGMNISSFSPFSIFNSNAVLPINFISLKIHKNKISNKLMWTTSATDAITTILEISEDGIHFEKIYETVYSAAGTYFDAAKNKKIYYRIKVTDVNGNYKYSNVVFADTDTEKIFIYPLLTNAQFTILNNDSEEKVLVLYDAAGRSLLSQNIIRGTNIVNVSRLNNGTYSYIVKGKLNSTTGFIIKQ